MAITAWTADSSASTDTARVSARLTSAPPRAVLAGLGVVVLWASAFPAVRVAVPEFGVTGLSFARLFVATMVLLALSPVFKVKLPRRRDIPLILGCGFFGMAAYQVLLNWGEFTVPAVTASMIVAAAPLVSVAVAAVAFGEKLTMVKVIGSAMAIAGVAVVASARSGLSLSSSVWILIGATVVQGIYHPMIKPLLRHYSGVEVATYGMVAGTVMLLPLLPGSWEHIMSASAGGCHLMAIGTILTEPLRVTATVHPRYRPT